jgi:hypothetical protein
MVYRVLICEPFLPPRSPVVNQAKRPAAADRRQGLKRIRCRPGFNRKSGGCPLPGFYFVFRGAPTAIAQSWPGCPCAGLVPGSALDGAAIGEAVGVTMGLAAGAAFEFRGAPTATEQSWPGWPCAGLVPAPAPAGADTGKGAGVTATGAAGPTGVTSAVLPVAAPGAAFKAGGGVAFKGAPTGIAQL